MILGSGFGGFVTSFITRVRHSGGRGQFTRLHAMLLMSTAISRVLLCETASNKEDPDKEDVVNAARRMLETYPRDLGRIDRDKLVACIDACFECDQACTACADACLSEDDVNHLTKCIRTCLDCADVCATTGRVLSRHTGYDANLTRTVLQTCAVACKTSGDECDKHAAKHEHCRVCAEVCRRCERACRDLVEALG